MPSRVLRIIAVIVAATVVIGTGVAWSKIRSFESGINHISSAALGGGGEDGAIDILLVGLDSRTDAHGNPLSQEELDTLRAGDDEATNTDTIILIRIPNNGKSATAISIPRDSYVAAPGIGKMKINGVYGSVHLEKLKKLVEEQGVDPSVAEPEANEAGREALIKTVANLTGVISGKTLASPATLNRLQEAVQRSVVLSDGWDVMQFAEQLQKLAAGNVAFATIPVLDENGWSDDGMQSVVRVDSNQVQDWVDGLLQDQDRGKTEELAYTPSKTAAQVINATDINGLAAAVSAALTNNGFAPGPVGNHDEGVLPTSQVFANAVDDLGAQAVSKDLGGLPIAADPSVPPGTVRVVLGNDYTGPGSGLDGIDPTLETVDPAATDSTDGAPPPSPIITAGSDNPDCVN